METQAMKSKKFTSALDDLITILIDHDFTLKEAQIFLQSQDILSDMMQQVLARDVDMTNFRKVTHCAEHVLGFIGDEYPFYASLLDSIEHREFDQIFLSLMQPRIYNRYQNWCVAKKMRALTQRRFYQTLESLKFRLAKKEGS